MPTTKRLIVTPARCIGCRSCEVACSFSHSARPAVPALSRIRAYLFAPDRGVPVTCLQCEQAACMKVCPTGALQRNPVTLAVDHDPERCIRCRMCTVACPFGNIHVDPAYERIVKCDVCGGEPACVRFCPTRALEWADQATPGPVGLPQRTPPALIAAELSRARRV